MASKEEHKADYEQKHLGYMKIYPHDGSICVTVKTQFLNAGPPRKIVAPVEVFLANPRLMINHMLRIAGRGPESRKINFGASGKH